MDFGSDGMPTRFKATETPDYRLQCNSDILNSYSLARTSRSQKISKLKSWTMKILVFPLLDIGVIPYQEPGMPEFSETTRAIFGLF